MENVIEVRSIEIRYAGVVVGRSTRVRDWGASGAFIGFAEPLPSGTSLVLRGDGADQAARVVEVFESADPAVAGMQVTFVGAGEAARPAQKPVAAAPSPAPAANPAPAPEAKVASTTTAAAPPPASAPSVTAAAPAETSDAALSAVSGEISAPATSQAEGQAGSDAQGGADGSAGQGGGKRRRRRR